jgi:hypothetical protein
LYQQGIEGGDISTWALADAGRDDNGSAIIGGGGSRAKRQAEKNSEA